jgi:hypothetical protein
MQYGLLMAKEVNRGRITANEAQRVNNGLGIQMQMDKNGIYQVMGIQPTQNFRNGFGDSLKMLDGYMRSQGTAMSPEALQEYGARGGVATPDIFANILHSLPQQPQGATPSAETNSSNSPGITPASFGAAQPPSSAGGGWSARRIQ